MSPFGRAHAQDRIDALLDDLATEIARLDGWARDYREFGAPSPHRDDVECALAILRDVEASMRVAANRAMAGGR